METQIWGWRATELLLAGSATSAAQPRAGRATAVPHYHLEQTPDHDRSFPRRQMRISRYVMASSRSTAVRVAPLLNRADNARLVELRPRCPKDLSGCRSPRATSTFACAALVACMYSRATDTSECPSARPARSRRDRRRRGLRSDNSAEPPRVSSFRTRNPWGLWLSVCRARSWSRVGAPAPGF